LNITMTERSTSLVAQGTSCGHICAQRKCSEYSLLTVPMATWSSSTSGPRHAATLLGRTGLTSTFAVTRTNDSSLLELVSAMENWRDACLQDRSIPVISVCDSCPMSALAAKTLKDMGFTDVAYLEGGTQAWKDAGLPTEVPIDN
jgi:rhodanese-related sulfurtransferase